jgi:hypothetical protein
MFLSLVGGVLAWRTYNTTRPSQNALTEACGGWAGSRQRFLKINITYIIGYLDSAGVAP